jgi:hypothetical protein
MTEAVSTPALKRKVLFVVDDERVIATTLATILNHAGFDAHAFFSAEAAVDSLDRLQPDLLITDVAMYGMNGIKPRSSPAPSCQNARFSYSRVRHPPVTCWKRQRRKVTNLRFWPNRFTPLICSKDYAANPLRPMNCCLVRLELRSAGERTWNTLMLNLRAC